MLKIDFDGESGPVLDRLIEAYGFTSKLALAQHFNLAASSLSGRYRRGGFPSDMVVRCMAETGASLEWLSTGEGKKFKDDELDILNLPRKKLVDGQLFESGFIMLDKAFFLAGRPLPECPFCLLDDKFHYIVDQKFGEIFDGEWLVNIEGKISVRTLVRIPIRKVRVSGVGMAFDCDINDINVIGRIALKIN